MARSLIRLPEVERRTGLSKSDIYRGQKDKTFPHSVPLGPRSVAWIADEVDAWIERTIAAARRPDAPRRPPIAQRKTATDNAPASAPATKPAATGASQPGRELDSDMRRRSSYTV
jgi:prophage regulatory protein